MHYQYRYDSIERVFEVRLIRRSEQPITKYPIKSLSLIHVD